jgi:flagellar protein FliO/FliZ
MQMLQQFFGEAGARYAIFALTALGLLIAVLLVWLLIRKILGSRLNFNDKPDRRGRAPRLGITDSFNVDRDGRRLVVVRRDNVEHLVMIGGPNDILIETNILRGERLTVGRNDQRALESEQLQTLPRQIVEATPPALTAPLPQAVMPPVAPEPVKKQIVTVAPAPATPPAPPAPPAPIAKRPEPLAPQKPIIAPKAPEPTPAQKAIEISDEERLVAEKALAEINARNAAIATVDSQSVAASAKEAVSKMMAPVVKKLESVRTAPEAPVPVENALPSKPSFADRMKVGRLFGGKTAKTEMPPPAPVTADNVTAANIKASLPEVEASPLLKSPIAGNPNKSFMEEMQKLEAVRDAKASDMKASLTEASAKLPPAPAMNDFKKMTESLSEQRAPAMPAPAAASAPSVAPPVTPPATRQATPAPVAPSRTMSKNPFDSLEEEMAKLLGRSPDGKG